MTEVCWSQRRIVGKEIDKIWNENLRIGDWIVLLLLLLLLLQKPWLFLLFRFSVFSSSSTFAPSSRECWDCVVQ